MEEGPPDGGAPPPNKMGGKKDKGDKSETGGADEITNTAHSGEDNGEYIGRNVERNWRGERWSNATHASVTDPDTRLYKKAKGRPAQLCYMGNALTENRHGFVVETELTHAHGNSGRTAALRLINRASPGSTRRITLGADTGYDGRGFVQRLRRMCVTPHVAAKTKRSAIDQRTTRLDGYRVRRKTMLRCLDRVGAQFTLTMAAYNLAKLPWLLTA